MFQKLLTLVWKELEIRDVYSHVELKYDHQTLLLKAEMPCEQKQRWLIMDQIK